jgi:hypothetical protein
MSKASDLDQKIAHFMGHPQTIVLKYVTLDELDKVIAHIQGLGYTFVLSSVKVSDDKMSHIASFLQTKPPYGGVHTDKGARSRLDAIHKLIIKFIDEYEPREEETD